MREKLEKIKRVEVLSKEEKVLMDPDNRVVTASEEEGIKGLNGNCLLYTSDAADDWLVV